MILIILPIVLIVLAFTFAPLTGKKVFKCGRTNKCRECYGMKKCYVYDGICNVSFIIIAIVGMIFLGIITFKQVKHEYAYTKDIYALEDNQDVYGEIHGSLFVSSGYIDTKQVYYYKADYKNGFKVYNSDASKSYIVETKNTSPHIIFHCESYEFANQNLIDILLFPFNVKPSDSIIIEYEYVVPIGTSSSNFNVDMQ